VGFANGSETYVNVVWLHICFFLCDSKLEIYEMGVPRDCMVVDRVWGCGRWCVLCVVCCVWGTWRIVCVRWEDGNGL
jgi:hypothetical protein